jgi:hypothetical protein
MTKLNLTHSKLSNTICIQEQENTQKQELSSEESTVGDYTRRHQNIPCSNRTPKPSNATKHGNRDGNVAQGVTNPLARDDHAPVNGEHFSRSKQQQNWRTTASKAGGHVSTRGRRNRADLALKNDKTEAPQIVWIVFLPRTSET